MMVIVLCLGVISLSLIVMWAPQRIVNDGQARTGAPSLMSAAERLSAENNVRTSLIQAFGGLVLLVGVFLTTRQLRINREQLAANWAQQDLTRQTSFAGLEASRKAQQGETLTRAVDQLGSDSATTRLGGVASLDLLATEDPRLRDLTMEILSAFIASSSRADSTKWLPKGSADGAVEGLTNDEATGWWGEPARVPRVEVQLALTVLGRLREGLESDLEELLGVQHRSLFNLDSANLAGARFSIGNFDGATFRRADLSEANLSGGRFEGAVFFLANCSRANFCGDFSGAHFGQALMVGADFHGADLLAADFEGAFLCAARFTRSDLRGANFANAILHVEGEHHADFKGARADAETVWPEGFDPASAGVLIVE
ncbi:pentapeptide repeat-containing protein [Nocardia sp. NRRL S-836]|uniref:pentapeptide repeat-containing protein n=1 Tax=Nocardia sp. NRRL S-836 TaxID=1519492 RepID=UPI0018D1C888|nr:pentapeptide repeat-containing protein [Nocardia sp. NRRL S-836]